MRKQKEVKIDDRNIIFVRQDREPSTLIVDGQGSFELPDAETQKQGFYHAHAAQIIRLLPQSYKKFVRKGDV